MSDSSQQPWSNNPNAPQLPHPVYIAEKDYFAGSVIAAVLYGVDIALFFQCMSAIFNPVYRTKKAVKWGLATHIFVMFSVSTVAIAITRRTFSLAYIDNREVPVAGLYPSGPLEYMQSTNFSLGVMQIIATLSFPINQWLVDGLLLYRCHVIYSMNYWATVIPGLMYLASIATGLSPLYRWVNDRPSYALKISYDSISLSLNVILTLMIIVRLVLHRRNIRNAVGASSGPSGLYTAIIVMLVESSALYTFTFLLYLVSAAVGSPVTDIFAAVGETQVISSFLIVLRVADRRALTSEAVASGNVGSMHFRSAGGSTGGGETVPDEYPTNGETSGELGVEVDVETVSRET